MARAEKSPCGTAQRYATGCRCRPCKRAHAADAKSRRDAKTVKTAAAELRKAEAAIEANLARLKSMLLPTEPQQWEIDKAIREERDALRLKVAELEGWLNECLDLLTPAQRTKITGFDVRGLADVSQLVRK